MKNREKNAEKMLDIACNGYVIAVDKRTGEVVPCNTGLKCEDCALGGDGNCRKKFIEWCNAEYKEPQKITIPEDTPIDTKIIVSEDEEKWIKRYFAGFGKDGTVLAWVDGATSWSIPSGCIFELVTRKWKFAKLASEENNDQH